MPRKTNFEIEQEREVEQDLATGRLRHRKRAGLARGGTAPMRQDRARRLAGGSAGASSPRPARRPERYDDQAAPITRASRP